jgi:hypothetical protein
VANMENAPPGTPARRALAALDNPPPDVPAVPHKRISAKVRRAIDAMVSGDCKQIKEAAEKVRLARESLSRALSTPHVAEHLRQKVLRHLAIAAARAGAVKGELLDSDSEIARDRASSFVLGLAGISPKLEASITSILGRGPVGLSCSPMPMIRQQHRRRCEQFPMSDNSL